MQNQNGKHIFFLGATRFDSSAQSTSFTMAKSLATNNYVYYVDYPITWKDYLTSKNKALIIARKSKFRLWSDGIISTNILNFKIVITPPLLSINFLPEGLIYRTALKLNEFLIRYRIKQVIKRFGIKDYIYINSFNFHYPGVADKLDPKLNIYHCVDPMIMPYDTKHGIISETNLVKKSDFVVCTSRQLFLEKSLLNPNTYFIPNAADINHSSKAHDDSLPVHSAIEGLKKPIIGYVGTIERRIDYDLLKKVIKNNPDKTFVFVGPVASEYIPKWLVSKNNIHLLGSIQYPELPSVLKGFDVAIIPFKKDPVSNTIFPLKLFEYLGAGKPVIATNFNKDLAEFTCGAVSYCEDEASFSEAISFELKNNDLTKEQKRIDIASQNTWEKRAEKFEELINNHIRLASS